MGLLPHTIYAREALSAYLILSQGLVAELSAIRGADLRAEPQPASVRRSISPLRVRVAPIWSGFALRAGGMVGSGSVSFETERATAIHTSAPRAPFQVAGAVLLGEIFEKMARWRPDRWSFRLLYSAGAVELRVSHAKSRRIRRRAANRGKPMFQRTALCEQDRSVTTTRRMTWSAELED